MTKAFLEPMVLKRENERFVLEAFSKTNLEKIRKFESEKKVQSKKVVDRKLKLSDLL
jgi:hypothetical protein